MFIHNLNLHCLLKGSSASHKWSCGRGHCTWTRLLFRHGLTAEPVPLQ